MGRFKAGEKRAILQLLALRMHGDRVQQMPHRALDRCQQYARCYRYVLQCDVRQFFPSIDQGLLRRTLGRVIADADVLWLIERILESGEGVLRDEYEMVWFPSDDLFVANRSRELPMGNLTS